MPDASAWAPKRASIMTKWAAQVDPLHVLPDYPRPQMVRTDWLNLNGVWQFQPGEESDSAPFGKTLASEILVPFPEESALSGVMEHHDRLWYRRTFTIPPTWKGQHVRINFGAIDYESEVYINGKSLGVHKGGYDPFSYDITQQLTGDGPQEIIVRVFDPVEKGGQPRGKQTTKGGGIMYTPSTGIWQTVWLEPVAADSIRDLHIVPDLDQSSVHVTAVSDGEAGARVKVSVLDGDKVVGSAEGDAKSEIHVPLPNAKLWSPESPFLYGLEISLSHGGKETDNVTSYFGMRKLALAQDAGTERIQLNGKTIFQFGPLDQGFWPDGIYTAPTEEAMKNDIQQMKALGFNMVRKHIKVEPARWYYWTDKLGLLVWQDMPSANSYLGKEADAPPVDVDEYKSELQRMIETHWNSPSIVLWITFNEGQGQRAFDTPEIVKMVKALDPSRLVNEASGGNIFGSGDLNDVHSYPQPSVRPITTSQAYVCGEFGGIGLKVDGHMWNNKGGGYANVSTGTDLLYLYAEFAQQVKTLRDEKGLCAAVYTQLTDVETELNGLMTYDRVPKCDFSKMALATQFSLPAPVYKPILPTSETGTPQAWKYTLEKPPGNWNKSTFDDATWTDGTAGFGIAGPLHLTGKTPWKTQDIWLRKHFNPSALTPDEIENLVVNDYHDDDVQVFINGISAYDQRGNVQRYEHRSLKTEARKAILPGADNVIAVHCLQKGGGQYIDVGIDLRVGSGS